MREPTSNPGVHGKWQLKMEMVKVVVVKVTPVHQNVKTTGYLFSHLQSHLHQTIMHGLHRDWRQPHGRPRHDWLYAIESAGCLASKPAISIDHTVFERIHRVTVT